MASVFSFQGMGAVVTISAWSAITTLQLRCVWCDVAAGDLFQVRGQTSYFVLWDAHEYLFIAGGIGVTPLLPMVEAVAARSLRYRILYGGRSAARWPTSSGLQCPHRGGSRCPSPESLTWCSPGPAGGCRSRRISPYWMYCWARVSTCLNDCREGICASCETAVVRGTIDHRDFVLSTAEKEAGDVLLPCLSRAAGVELVLDL